MRKRSANQPADEHIPSKRYAPKRPDHPQNAAPVPEGGNIKIIELYTDGCPDWPGKISVAASESAFRRAEMADFRYIERVATVKGSTITEFHDDRSVTNLR